MDDGQKDAMGNVIEARGENYYIDPGFPLALSIVRAENRPQHPYDLTCEAHYHNFSELVIVTAGIVVPAPPTVPLVVFRFADHPRNVQPPSTPPGAAAYLLVVLA